MRGVHGSVEVGADHRNRALSKKPKQDADDESLPYIIGTGNYQLIRENIKKPKVVKIVGFVRPKVKQKKK